MEERNFQSHNCSQMDTPATPPHIPTTPKRKKRTPTTYNLTSIYTTPEEQEDTPVGHRPAAAAAAAAAYDTEDEDLLQPLWKKRQKPPEGQTSSSPSPEGKKKCVQGRSSDEVRRTADWSPAAPDKSSASNTIHTSGEKRQRPTPSDGETEDSTVAVHIPNQKVARHGTAQTEITNTTDSRPNSRNQKSPPDKRYG